MIYKKLCEVVDKKIVKKDVYNAKIKDIKDKIPDITDLAANPALNVKTNEVKNEIPNITNLATATAFPAVENKIPNITYLKKQIIMQE